MDFNRAYERYYNEYGKKAESLFRAIRESIVEGELAEGMRLPPTRKLAALYEISRGAVTEAYERLYAEGFVKSEAGNGTFVTHHPKASVASTVNSESESSDQMNISVPSKVAAEIKLSKWAKRLQHIHSLNKTVAVENETSPMIASNLASGAGGTDQRKVSPLQPIDFSLVSADAGLFPADEWKKAMYAEIRDAVKQYPQPAASEGYLPLREAIAGGLRRDRGMHADPDQIVLTNGSMQAITLLAMLLLSPGDDVVLENPTYPGIQQAIFTAGGRIGGAPVDDEGIIPQDWDAKLLLVTPTRHFPTGAALSPLRRRQLLDWANRRNAIIIEDDYDSTFSWGGRRLESLKAMDEEDRVIYVGTFSRAMLRDQRIGYVWLPQALVEPFHRAKMLFEPKATGLIEQRALTAFIASGSYERHMRRVRRVCGRKLVILREALAGKLNQWFRFVHANAGLHVYAEWRGDVAEYERLKSVCGAFGVSWADSSRYWLAGMERGQKPGALFGFAHLTEEQILEGAARIELLARQLEL